jgi:hypothetical protein
MSEEKNEEVEILDEYDFSNAVIGKYAKQYAEGTNIVVLEPDVAKGSYPLLSIFRQQRIHVSDANAFRPTTKASSVGCRGIPSREFRLRIRLRDSITLQFS